MILLEMQKYDSAVFGRETKGNLKDFEKFLSFQKTTNNFQKNKTEFSLHFIPFASHSFLCPFIYLNLAFTSPIYWINLAAQIAV